MNVYRVEYVLKWDPNRVEAAEMTVGATDAEHAIAIVRAKQRGPGEVTKIMSVVLLGENLVLS